MICLLTSNGLVRVIHPSGYVWCEINTERRIASKFAYKCVDVNWPLASTSASSVNAALLRILCERGLSFTIYCFSVSKSVAKREETERIEIFSHAMENFLPFALTVSQKYASKRKTENGRKVYLSFMSLQLLDCSCKC